MGEFDRTKFSFKETFLNTNGKTSSTKLIGMCASAMCVLLFTTMCIFYMFNVAESAVVIILIDKIIAFFGIAAGLMGVKSITSSFGTNHRLSIDNREYDETDSKGKHKHTHEVDIEET